MKFLLLCIFFFFFTFLFPCNAVFDIKTQQKILFSYLTVPSTTAIHVELFSFSVSIFYCGQGWGFEFGVRLGVHSLKLGYVSLN